MTPGTYWLGRVAVVLAWGALFLGAAALFVQSDGPGRVALGRYVTALDSRCRFLRLELRGQQVLGAQAALSLLCLAIAFLRGPGFVISLLPIVAFTPKIALERKAAGRIAAVEAQLEAWLGAIANSLKASTSLGEAIASTSRLVPSPMSQEVDHIVREYELGTPLDEAVQHLAERVPSKTVAGAVLAIKVARQSGGDLPLMLENAGAALRELARLEGVVRSKTAEGKAQALVISAIPVPMVLGIYFLDPHFFDPLSGTFVGQLVIAGAAFLWATAILLARKILAVDV